MNVVTIQVNFALLLYDDYSGAPLRDAGPFCCTGGRVVRPIRKPEGILVFTGLPSRPELTVECHHYRPETLRVDLAALEPDNPLVHLRMKREHKPFFRDCGWIRGKGPPGAEVMVLAREPTLKLQSAERETNGTRLSMQGYVVDRLEGRRYALAGKRPEDFILTGKVSSSTWRTPALLRETPREGEAVYRAYRARCDNDGGFWMPVDPPDAGDTPKHLYCWNGEASRWDSV